MALPVASTSEGAAGSEATFQARIVSKDGTGTAVSEEGSALQQANISSITCAVYDLHSATPAVAVATPSVTVSSAISDTLTNDNLWTEDTTGRNFLHTIAGSTFASGDHTYRVVYTLTTTGGNVFKWAHEHRAVAMTPGG